MSGLTFETHSAEETTAAGRTIGAALLQHVNQGLLLILCGELGAGKTTLTKGIAEIVATADPEDVTSPTFTLVHEYDGDATKLYHLDLYRLDEERQLNALGIDEMVGPGNVVLIEWGKKFPGLVARCDGEIELLHRGADRRVIELRWKQGRQHPSLET